MAINPFRVGELQLPQPLRPVPIDFSPLSAIGDTIGAFRQQQQVGDIIKGATDEAGNLDHVKAADELSKAGLQKYAEPLYALANRRQVLSQDAAAQAETGRHHRRLEDLTAERQSKEYQTRLAELKSNRQRDDKPPTNYRWIDPDDHDKGVTPIAGGPAEKVDAEVAARMGLAKNFLAGLDDTT